MAATRVLRPPVITDGLVRVATPHSVRVLLLVMVVVAGSGLGAAVMVSSEHGATVALGSLLLLLVVAHVVGAAVLFLRPRRGRLEIDAVSPSGDRMWLPGMPVLGLFGVAGPLLVVALGVALLTHLVAGEHTGSRLLASAPVALVLIALAGPALVAAVRGHSVPPRIGLGPDDVVRRSGRTEESVAWSDVVAVGLVTAPAPPELVSARVPPARTTVGRPSLGERAVGGPPSYGHALSIPTNLHGSDPSLVAELLAFYWRHPQHRDELGTPAAVDRIERGDFLDPRPRVDGSRVRRA